MDFSWVGDGGKSARRCADSLVLVRKEAKKPHPMIGGISSAKTGFSGILQSRDLGRGEKIPFMVTRRDSGLYGARKGA